MKSMRVHLLCLMGLLLLALLQMGHAQSIAPSPAADAPMSHAKTIDEGIAYALLLIALAVTYLIH